MCVYFVRPVKKYVNPHHGSGCGVRRAVVAWLLSTWIGLKDTQ